LVKSSSKSHLPVRPVEPKRRILFFIYITD
jgi:hypothetical protein